VETQEVEAFFDVVRAGFGQKRKQLRNSLQHGLGLPAARVAQALEQAGVDGERRAQTLTLDEWVALSRTLRALRDDKHRHLIE
jgi:16S rRNA (adenine1518-N6/adenine1519-N6)-dimethyltransferase